MCETLFNLTAKACKQGHCTRQEKPRADSCAHLQRPHKPDFSLDFSIPLDLQAMMNVEKLSTERFGGKNSTCITCQTDLSIKVQSSFR